MISTLTQIENNVKYRTDDFSFTDTVGELIGNREFSFGYRDYTERRESGIELESKETAIEDTTYIYTVLSAIGNDLAETVYSNVRNYIDLACDVDVCKMKSLKSIMQMTGMQYSIFENNDMYPVEIENLLNLFSMNPNILFKSSRFKQAYVASLRESGSLSGYIMQVAEAVSGDYVTETEKAQYAALSSSQQWIDFTTYDEQRYREFVRSTYENVIKRVLLQQYFTQFSDSINGSPFVFKDYVENGLEATRQYDKYKTQHGIKSTFDATGIADDIYEGRDSMDNYQGYELSLLNVIFTDRSASPSGYAGSPDTRYAYYRRRQVQQYEQFILDKYYSITVRGADSEIQQSYDIDPNYYLVKNRERNRLFLDDSPHWNDFMKGGYASIDDVFQHYVIDPSPAGSGIFNYGIIKTVIDSLVDTTMYIQRLREKIKLQVRKTYMKGTNNLLLYLTNEYLNNYIEQDRSLSDVLNESNPNQTRSIDQLEVEEYDDETEYYNIGTDQDWRSDMGGKTCNDRFFENSMNVDGLAFKLDQIQGFYLSVMNMQADDMNRPDEFMRGFLCAVYDVGARKDSISQPVDGLRIVNTQLERDGMYTDEMYQHLTKLSVNYGKFSAYLSDGYEFPDDTVSVQISDAVENYVYTKLSVSYLSGIREVYDIFEEKAGQLSARWKRLDDQYEDMLSGQMSFYYNIPDKDVYPNSFDEKGTYRHDYYVGNSSYAADPSYTLEKYNQLSLFSANEKNIINYPVVDCAEAVSADMVTLSNDHFDKVVKPISCYGYIDISSMTLDAQFESTKSFLNSQIAIRIQTLNSAIDNVRAQANQLRTQYDTLYAAVTGMISNYKKDAKDLYISFAGSACKYNRTDCWLHHYYRGNEPNGDKNITSFYCFNDNMYYWEDKDNTDAGCHIEGVLADPYEVSLTGNIKDILSNFETYITQVTAVEYRKPNDYKTSEPPYNCEIKKITQGKLDSGILASIAMFNDQYSGLEKSYESVYNQYNTLIGSTPNSNGQVDVTGLSEKINTLIDNVSSTTFSETVFEKDKVCETYRKYIAIIVQLESKYGAVKLMWDNIFSDSIQSSYLSEFTKPMDLTFLAIYNLLKYAGRRDKNNKRDILSQIQQRLAEYDALMADFDAMVQETAEYDMLYYPQYGASYFEVEYEHFMNALALDVEMKYDKGYGLLQAEYRDVTEYVKAICEEISDSLGSSVKFTQVVGDRLDYLNFFTQEKYAAQRKLFMTYSGRDFCDYPYYNVKNQEHPSYQTHPFLWNFIKHANYEQLVTKQFQNIDIPDFEPDSIAGAISDYIGRFGESINEWRHGVIDYSGYTVSYETSQHYSNSQLTSEVVDYLGPFYPPAVDYADQHYAIATKSLSAALSAADMNTVGAYAPTVNNYVRQLKRDGMCLSYGKTGIQVSDVVQQVETVVDGTTVVSENLSSDVRATLAAYPDDAVRLEQTIRDNVQKSFYERFYNHLNLSYGDISAELCRIAEYRDDIREIVEDKTSELDVYDIYKYSTDVYGNHYTLFKRYGKADPSYSERRNQFGELWIRRRDYPLSYPAFKGARPNVETTDVATRHPSIYRLEHVQSDVSAAPFDDNVPYFYDFDMTNDGKLMTLAAYQTDQGRYDASGEVYGRYNAGRDISALHDFRRAALIFCRIQAKTDPELADYTKITLYDDNTASKYTDFLYSSQNTHYSERPDLRLPGYFAYLGNYCKGNDQQYFVFAGAEDGRLRGGIRIYKMSQQRIESKADDQDGACTVTGKTALSGSVSDQVCFSYDSSHDQTTFAYLVEPANSLSVAAGPDIRYPAEKEMNSRDMFSTDLAIQQLRISGYGIKINSSCRANSNADMSYIPAYPGLSRATDLRDDYILSYDYRNVEFLGFSNDLTDEERRVNRRIDPYYDYNRLADEYEQGRVYEDYESTECRRNFWMAENGLITNYDARTGEAIQQAWLTYDITTAAELRRNADVDFHSDRWQLLMYNVTSLGKSPYYAGRLDTLLDGREHFLDYDNAHTAVQIGDGAGEVRFNGLAETAVPASNRIRGVSRMSIQLVNGNVRLKMYFDVSELPAQYVSVPAGRIRMLFFNQTDLRAFERFHLFDVYGIVNAYDLNGEIAEQVIRGEGWTILNRTRVTDEMVWNDMKSYYENRYGTKKFLISSDSLLEDYDYLSDVWLFKGDGGMQFKYDEEALFEISSDNYYFPTLNCTYPKQFADFAAEQSRQMKYDDIDQLSQLFGDSDVYVLELLDEARIKQNMGSADIQIQYADTDSVRVFEDYLSTDYSVTPPVKNCDKFQPDDFDNMVREFYHSCETELPGLSSVDDPQTIFVRRDDVVTGGLRKRYQRVDIAGSDADVSQFMKVYANYARCQDGRLCLYFNYVNMLNTPFTEMRGMLEYPCRLDNTYLKLMPGEDGILDIVVQLKSYSASGLLQGIKNAKLASFHIYNVSDDKPKCVIDKTFEIRPGDLLRQADERLSEFRIFDFDFDLTDAESQEPAEQDVFIGIDSTYDDLSGQFTIEYPYEIISFGDQSGSGWELTDYGPGMMTLQLQRFMTGIRLRAKTAKPVQDMLKYKYDKYQVFTSVARVNSKCELIDAVFGFKYQTDVKYTLLGRHGDESEHETIFAHTARKNGGFMVNRKE